MELLISAGDTTALRVEVPLFLGDTPEDYVGTGTLTIRTSRGAPVSVTDAVIGVDDVDTPTVYQIVADVSEDITMRAAIALSGDDGAVWEVRSGAGTDARLLTSGTVRSTLVRGWGRRRVVSGTGAWAPAAQPSEVIGGAFA